ncbi:MAG: hypothetical protein NT069_01190, partial [Planctomycetota bacterium]|nr:hypothetical protein [Planctomycetota bacterium]
MDSASFSPEFIGGVFHAFFNMLPTCSTERGSDSPSTRGGWGLARIPVSSLAADLVHHPDEPDGVSWRMSHESPDRAVGTAQQKMRTHNAENPGVNTEFSSPHLRPADCAHGSNPFLTHNLIALTYKKFFRQDEEDERD